MAFAQITITSLPAARSDGTSAGTADYGSANVYKNGTQYGSIAGPLTAGTSAFTDTVAAVMADSWTASIVDTQTPPVEGAQSLAFVVGVLPHPIKAPLNAPTILGALV